ncbi:MAG: ribonuclease III, partial [Planctomycetota bacterium]
ALTHASATGGDALSNERLEFLGDAVVALAVCNHLFRQRPDLSEGEMTVIKSAVVSRRTMARVGRSLGLSEFLRVDYGLRQRASYPSSMVAGAYEAVVGAILVDGGMEAAVEFILRTLGPEIERTEARQHKPSYKSILQEKAQAEGKGAPRYSLVRYEGPDHRPRYLTVVHICGEKCGAGWGSSKKTAEQEAAKDALDKCYPGWDER